MVVVVVVVVVAAAEVAVVVVAIELLVALRHTLHCKNLLFISIASRRVWLLGYWSLLILLVRSVFNSIRLLVN